MSATSGIILRSTNGGGLWTLDYISSLSPAVPILSISMSRAAQGMVGVAGFQRGGQIIVRSIDPSSAPTLGTPLNVSYYIPTDKPF